MFTCSQEFGFRQNKDIFVYILTDWSIVLFMGHYGWDYAYLYFGDIKL